MGRISVDFNTKNMGERERVYVAGSSHPELLGELKDGERVVLIEPDDIEVEAVLEYDLDHGEFLGPADWSTRRDLSGLSDAFSPYREVVCGLPEEEGLPAGRFHECVPEWPKWVQGKSTYGGGKIAAPFFVTRYDGQDYAVHQGVNWSDSTLPPRLSYRVVVYKLDREPRDAEWP